MLHFPLVVLGLCIIMDASLPGVETQSGSSSLGMRMRYEEQNYLKSII